MRPRERRADARFREAARRARWGMALCECGHGRIFHRGDVGAFTSGNEPGPCTERDCRCVGCRMPAPKSTSSTGSP